MDLSPKDERVLAQTVLGEAGPNATPEEYAAITHTILNRQGLGGYPDSPSAIARQPKQYQTWDNPDAENYAGRYGEKSPGWDTAIGAVRDAASGDLPDVTNGATHYLQPETVQKWVSEGKQKWPSWAQGEGQRIGQHSFYHVEDNRKPKTLSDDEAEAALAARRSGKGEMSDEDAEKALAARRREIASAVPGGRVSAKPKGVTTGRVDEQGFAYPPGKEPPPKRNEPSAIEKIIEATLIPGRLAQGLYEGKGAGGKVNAIVRWAKENPETAGALGGLLVGGPMGAGARAIAPSVGRLFAHPLMKWGAAGAGAAGGAAGIPELGHVLHGGIGSLWDIVRGGGEGGH